MAKVLDENRRRVLVFGASGQIGRAVLDCLHEQGWAVVAVSRQWQPANSGIAWVQGDFHAQWTGERHFEAVISCGPLNHFVRWFIQGPLFVRRVVAFGSTSAQVKQDSQSPEERRLADALAHSEQTLLDYCLQRKVAATVLRPTMIWGAGRDMSISRIARLGARRRFFVVPAAATGLRQPVHVQDLADAAVTVLGQPRCHGNSYDLPGGESLSYLQMVRRIQSAVPGCTPLLQIPLPLFELTVRGLQKAGRLPGLTPAVLDRMQQDLVFDLTPAQRDFGYAPRGFLPTAAELGLAQ